MGKRWQYIAQFSEVYREWGGNRARPSIISYKSTPVHGCVTRQIMYIQILSVLFKPPYFPKTWSSFIFPQDQPC